MSSQITCIKLRQSRQSGKRLEYFSTIHLLTRSCAYSTPFNIMSLSNTSTTMFRRALLSSRLAAPAECSARTIRPVLASYRQVSSSARLPTLTASETRRRPTVRPFQQPASQGGVNGLSPTSKRTIFIQTENTPNPDVSLNSRWAHFQMNHQLTIRSNTDRPLNSSPTTVFCPRISPAHSWNI